MIVGKIRDIGMYKGISKNLDTAIDSILKEEYKTAPIGKTVIDGDNVFFSSQAIESTKDYEESLFETHKKYIDIQMVTEGSEGFGVLLSDEGLEVNKPFNYETDFGTFKKYPETIFNLVPGEFIIFFTDEPHMPCLKVGEKNSIKKVVYKVAK